MRISAATQREAAAAFDHTSTTGRLLWIADCNSARNKHLDDYQMADEDVHFSLLLEVCQDSFGFAPQSNALSAPIVQLVGVFDIEFLERNQISASQT